MNTCLKDVSRLKGEVDISNRQEKCYMPRELMLKLIHILRVDLHPNKISLIAVYWYNII